MSGLDLRRSLHGCLLLLASCATATLSFADAPPAAPASVPAPLFAPVITPFPSPAMKQGQSLELSLSGRHLSAIASVAVADARGLDVSLIKPEKPDDHQLRLKIAAAADAAPGKREFRLVGPGGISEPLTVHISPYPVIAEKRPASSAEPPQEISLPATITGRVERAGDIDQYRFHATKGQHLLFDLNANREGSPLEAIVAVQDAAGHELPSQTEHHGLDPLLIFDAPEEGSYVLKVRDLEYRGGGNFDYRIEAGPIPYLEALIPTSGQPGKVIEAKAIGHNLEGGEKITIDLTSAAPGRMMVRAKTAAGLSNEVPFDVTDLPQTVEKEPNDNAETATPVSLPVEISGHIDKPGDEDFYKFHIAYKQPVHAEVFAGRFGSPVSPLLQLRNAKGHIIESNDGAPGADARIGRELDPGDYLVSVRDLTYAGGPAYSYRVKIQLATSLPQDFSMRFQPDAPRINRGGHAALWCEVTRQNGYRGDVNVTLEGLPAGVTAAPVTLGESTSGVFTLSAAPDAALGPVPLKLKAVGTIGAQQVTHEGQPEIAGRVVAQSYLTVLEAAPFTVDAVATLTPQRLEQFHNEIQSLAVKLATPQPGFDAALAEWEKKVSSQAGWTILEPQTLAAAQHTGLSKQPDHSILATGITGQVRDDYQITFKTDVKNITAIRLEALTHPMFPAQGPGAAPNGNFVLTEFKATATKEGQPAQEITFKKATADFSQEGFPVSNAIDANASTGWAIQPEMGKDHVAVFETANPAAFDGPVTLTVILQQQSIYDKHMLGHFRISVTAADPSTIPMTTSLPAEVTTVLKTPQDQRTPEQKARIAEYFRSIDPQTAADHNRLEGLRNSIEPYAEIARLEAALSGATPQLEAEMAQWEKSLAAGAGWTALEPTDPRSAGGARLSVESDGSILASGPTPPVDTYTFSASTMLKGITAVRFEVLPDPTLPNNGPGRAADGTFFLTRFGLAVAPKTAAPNTPPAAPVNVEFASARASAEQPNMPASFAIDERNDTGWGIPPAPGRPVVATFFPKMPIGAEGGSTFRFTLEHLSPEPPLTQHLIGRFRVWVTTAANPDAAVHVPQNIATLLKNPNRNDQQKAALLAYYRSISPSLSPIRQRLADLKAMVPSLPLAIARGKAASIPVPINRNAFKGDVQITLEGFSTGRDTNRMPMPITKNLKLNPLVITGNNSIGELTFTADPSAEVGTRMVVLRAESKIGEDSLVQYSPAFPLTVTER